MEGILKMYEWAFPLSGFSNAPTLYIQFATYEVPLRNL